MDLKRLTEALPDEPFLIGMIPNLAQWQTLLDYVLAAQKSHPQQRLLCSFDDEGQSAYTSMHSSLSDKLFLALEDDEAADEACLSFLHRRQVLRRSALPLAALFGKLGLDAVDLSVVAFVNQQPLALCDLPIRLSCAPVEQGADLLAVVPNGYFECDFTPFENHALSVHLAQAFGYELFAIGAAFLGFVRPQRPAKPEITALCGLLSELYGWPQADVETALAPLLSQQTHLFLPYVESLAHYVASDDSVA